MQRKYGLTSKSWRNRPLNRDSPQLKVASITAASTVILSTALFADHTMSKGAEAAVLDVIEMTVAAMEPSNSFGFNQAKGQS